MFTDSHCHLASHRFGVEEIPEIIARAKAAGISRLITLATSLDDVPLNLALAENPSVHACIGIHPCEVHQAPDDAVSQLAAFTHDTRVCAIGETGLDYYHPAPESWQTGAYHLRQRDFLHAHFQLAASAGLNLVIHTRDQEGCASFEDALAIYQKYHHQVRAVFHCFVGPWENAARVIALGGLVSFGGVVTFKSARQVRETAGQCPPGSFILETDSPYLAPEPHRGERNEPAFTRFTAENLASLREESLNTLAAATEQAAAEFFRLRTGSVE